MVAVASSCSVIWKQPSPSMQTTVASGRPRLAPSAAGKPKPIVPRPPEVTKRRGVSTCRYWAAHIWCWPTPDRVVGLGPPPGERGGGVGGAPALGPPPPLRVARLQGLALVAQRVGQG